MVAMVSEENTCRARGAGHGITWRWNIGED